jgi:hypothetical protein
MQVSPWRGGRVVEGAALEMLFRGNVNEGSNPSLSVLSCALSATTDRAEGATTNEIYLFKFHQRERGDSNPEGCDTLMDFESTAFNRSATSPYLVVSHSTTFF